MANHGPVEAWLTWAFSPTISTILVTLFISLLSPLLIHYYLYRKAVSKELPSFLLLGPSGGGKTSLLTLLANSSPTPTHTSQTPTTALLTLPASIKSSDSHYRSEHDTSQQPQFLLIDTPGHGKLRHHATTSLTTTSALKGLIYVLDSAAIASSTGLNEAAEFLYDVLLMLQKRHTAAKTSKAEEGIAVLVAANKQDVFSSLPVGLVRRRLEEEVGRVREARSRGLLDSGVEMGDEGEGGEEENWLGEYGAKQFGFAQMEEHGVDVKVVGGNVVGDGGGVEEWWAWIGENL